MTACRKHGLAFVSYCPLARGTELFGQAPVAEAAARHGKTPAQVLLNWVIDRPGVMAIPKTDRVERVDEAVGAVGWSLTPAQRRTLTGG